MRPLPIMPQPVLEAGNYLMNALSMDDLEPMFEMRSDPRQLRYIQRPLQHTKAETKAWLEGVIANEAKGEGITWAIRSEARGELLGAIGFYRTKWEHLRTEIGYMLRINHHRKGIMSTCVPVVCRWAFESWGVHSIEANIHPENQASRGVLMKCGFRKEAYFKENYYFNGMFYDSEIYGLLKEDLNINAPSGNEI